MFYLEGIFNSAEWGDRVQQELCEASQTLTHSVKISTALLFVPSKVTESEGNLGRKMAPDLD